MRPWARSFIACRQRHPLGLVLSSIPCPVPGQHPCHELGGCQREPKLPKTSLGMWRAWGGAGGFLGSVCSPVLLWLANGAVLEPGDRHGVPEPI